MDTMLIEVTDQKAIKLLHNLEELNLIKALEEHIQQPSSNKLSDKYNSVFSKEDAKSFDEHTNGMRNEWNDI